MQFIWGFPISPWLRAGLDNHRHGHSRLIKRVTTAEVRAELR